MITPDTTGASVNISSHPAPQTPEEEAAAAARKGQTEGGSENGTGTQEGADAGDDKGEDEGDGIDPDTGEPIDYKAKFAASTTENQRILQEHETLNRTISERDTKIADLIKDLEETRKIAEGKNPEGLTAVEAQRRLETTTRELALLKEAQALDQFVSGNALAKDYRATLQQLGRANPTTPLQQLWDIHLKDGAEAKAAAAKTKADAIKKGQGDRGRGTSTREPSGGSKALGGHTQAEFDKLPVAKRRDILIKAGAI